MQGAEHTIGKSGNAAVRVPRSCHRSMAELVASHALHWRTSAPVALATGVHAGRDFLLQHIARFHRSMTFGTMEPGLDMRRMAKEDKIRNAIHRHPSDVLALSEAALSFATSGLFALIVRWHVRQKSREGTVASSPLAAPTWQKLHWRPTFPA